MNYGSNAYENVKSDGTHAVYSGIYNPGGKITITGSAKLYVGANNRAIYADNSGEIIFDNARDVEIVTFGGDALHARDITLKGNSRVSASTGYAGAGAPLMNVYATYTIKVHAGSSLSSSCELAVNTTGRDYAGIKCFSAKNGGGIYAYGGEIRSEIYPAGYDIGSNTLYAIDAPTVNIEGDGVVDGKIYNWFNPNEYYVNSVVYGYSGGNGKVNFNGAGILRLQMSVKKAEGSSKIQQLRPDSVSFADNLLYRTDTSGNCREEITAYSCDGIFLSSKGVIQYWSYSEKNLYPSEYGHYSGSGSLKSAVLELKDLVTKTLHVPKLVVTENCAHLVNPNVSEGLEIPEMTVKSGATLALRFEKDRDYTFTKPIYLEGGTLEIRGDVGSGVIKGLDVRGNGTVIFIKGTVSGNVERTVKAVMYSEYGGSGNIDIPDYGNAVDQNGNTVHKCTYKAETEYDYFDRVCMIYQVEQRDYLSVEGKFHIAENGDKMLYLWTDRTDRPYRIEAYPNPHSYDNPQLLSLKYGTNTFAPGTPFTLKENGVFVAKAGDNVVLFPLAGGNPTDLQKSFVSWVKWYVSKDGGETFELVQKTQGPTSDNRIYPDTIRFEYVLPEITEVQNGYIYRCEVCYCDVMEWERTSYYYDATLYVDTPQLVEPERYVDSQPARLEMTHGTTLAGVTFRYRWELSRNGGSSWETVQEGASAVYETAAVTDAMEGWQIRVVYGIYAGGKKLSERTTDPVTIDTIGKLPVITKHPESVVLRQSEEFSDQFPPDPDQVPIIISGPYYSFSIEAEGENLHYQWQRSKDNGRTFVDLPDENEARTKGWYKIEPGTAWQYRCIVYNDFGSVISNVAIPRTLYAPTTSNPQDLTVPEYTDAIFRVDISQGFPYGTDVIWQVSKDGKTMVDVTAEDGTVNVYSEVVNGVIHWYTTLTISNVSQDMSGYMYRCIVKNKPNDENYNGLRRSEHATLTVTYNCAVDGHIFDEGTVKSEPTCTDSGSTVFTCSACNYIDTRFVASLGHDWKPATCRSVKTCLREGCGISEGNFDYTNHIGTPVWNEDEWGDVDGHISKWSCCGIIDHPYERHTFKNGVCPTCGCVCSHPIKREANCHTEGTCEICGLKTEDINPNNHDLSLGTTTCDKKDPTCTEEGYTGDTVCWHCLGVTEKGTSIPAKGHDTTWKANCREAAYCTVCKEYYGEKDPNNHREPLSAYYTNATETTHEQHWGCCDMVKTFPHDLDEEGVCKMCHYGCVHTGGTANCVEPAHCEKCGEPYGEIDPDNHEYFRYYPNEDNTHTERCECGKIISGPEPHTWEDGTCTVCYTTHWDHPDSDWIVDSLPSFGMGGYRYKECPICHMLTASETLDAIGFDTMNVGHNCSFGNDLSMLYAILKSDLAGCTDIRLVVTKENGTASKTLVPTERTINGKTYYCFEYRGVSAKEMGDTLTAELEFLRDGVKYCGTVDTYSLKAYAMERLSASSDETFKTLLVDLLNYGAAAQIYFAYKTDALVNADLSSEQNALSAENYSLPAMAEAGNNETTYPAAIKGKNVLFGNRIELLVATNLGKNSDLAGVSLRILYTNLQGEAMEKLIDGKDFVYRDDVNGYTAYFNGLNASEFRTVLELTLVKDGKDISETVKYSLDTYANNRLASSTDANFKVLLEKTLIYADSAKAYFSAIN